MHPADADFSAANEPDLETLEAMMTSALALSSALAGADPAVAGGGRRWRPPERLTHPWPILDLRPPGAPGGTAILPRPEPDAPLLDLDRAMIFAQAMEDALNAKPTEIEAREAQRLRRFLRVIAAELAIVRELQSVRSNPVLEAALTSIDLGMVGVARVAGRDAFPEGRDGESVRDPRPDAA